MKKIMFNDRYGLTQAVLTSMMNGMMMFAVSPDLLGV